MRVLVYKNNATTFVLVLTKVCSEIHATTLSDDNLILL